MSCVLLRLVEGGFWLGVTSKPHVETEVGNLPVDAQTPDTSIGAFSGRLALNLCAGFSGDWVYGVPGLAAYQAVQEVQDGCNGCAQCCEGLPACLQNLGLAHVLCQAAAGTLLHPAATSEGTALRASRACWVLF